VAFFGCVKGLFMALNPRIIACGNRRAAFAAAMRFVVGPAVMLVASYAVGLRGVLLHVAIIQVVFICMIKNETLLLCLLSFIRFLTIIFIDNKQAALPQGIVPFVFAKEYNVHPDILSTA